MWIKFSHKHIKPTYTGNLLIDAHNMTHLSGFPNFPNSGRTPLCFHRPMHPTETTLGVLFENQNISCGQSFKKLRDLCGGNRVLIEVKIFQNWTFVVHVNSLRCRSTQNSKTKTPRSKTKHPISETKHPRSKTKTPKSRKRSTQNSKTKHSKLENEDP